MGMPSSETALEEFMRHVLGDFLQEGWATKLADDLYCGGNTRQELIANFSRILDDLAQCNLRLSATKTAIGAKQPPSWFESGHKAPYLQAPTSLLHSQPATLQSL